MKHNPVAISKEDLCERVAHKPDVIMDNFGYLFPDVDECPENWTWFIPDGYFVVTWADHVTIPKYTGEAVFHGPMSREKAAAYRDGVIFYGEFDDEPDPD